MKERMKLQLAKSTSVRLSVLLAAALACAACAAPSGDDDESTEASSAALSRGGLGVDGDACTVRTNPDGTKVPGTVSGLECCSTAKPTDCVIILKPFPGGSFSRAAF